MARRAISKRHLRKMLSTLVRSATDEWLAKRDDASSGELLLYFLKPNKKLRLGRLKVSDKEPNRGWQLVCPMILSKRWSEEEAAFFIEDRLLHLPILRGPFKD